MLVPWSLAPRRHTCHVGRPPRLHSVCQSRLSTTTHSLFFQQREPASPRVHKRGGGKGPPKARPRQHRPVHRCLALERTGPRPAAARAAPAVAQAATAQPSGNPNGLLCRHRAHVARRQHASHRVVGCRTGCTPQPGPPSPPRAACSWARRAWQPVQDLPGGSVLQVRPGSQQLPTSAAPRTS